MTDGGDERFGEATLPSWAFAALMAFGVLLIKLVAFLLDPQPQLFLGDSAGYIRTALTDWRPGDRSYLYGLLVRWLVNDTRSLIPLVLAQVLASAASACLAALWVKQVFAPARWSVVTVAMLCALDPAQLLFERYVLTETFSLFALAATIVLATSHTLRGRPLSLVLAIVAGLGVIALRTALLPAVLVLLVAAPLLSALGARGSWRRALGCAAGASLLFMPLAKSVNAVSKTGPFLLAAWSAAVVPQDFPDVSMGERVMAGVPAEPNDPLFTREVERWHHKGLIHRLRAEVPDPAALDAVAKTAALNALVRNPLAVATAAWGTYRSLWQRENRERLIGWDLGAIPRDAELRRTLETRYSLVVDERRTPSATGKVYANVTRWSALVSLVLPALLLFAALKLARPQQVALGLLALASLAILVTVSLLSTLPVIRYLLPLSWISCAGVLGTLAARSGRYGSIVREASLNAWTTIRSWLVGFTSSVRRP